MPRLRTQRWLARRMIFAGNPKLGLLFTANPVVLFSAASMSAILMMIFPAWLFGLGSMIRKGQNVGFLHSKNWSVMYTVIIPFMLVVADLLFAWIPLSIAQLLRRGVIAPSKDVSG